MRILEVNASKKYNITIDKTLDGFGDLVTLIKGENVAVVTDDNVDGLYGNALDRFLTDKKVVKIVIKSGEASKNAENFLAILNRLAELGFKRNDGIVALGGGVVGDLAAFCASTYMRGISLLAVPTTLLSMVDSSVGGKTAINLERGKNLCGTFYQPDGVYICTEFLKTLPKRELMSGFGEVIKYAFLSKDITLADIEGGDSEELVYKCLKIKAGIVERDERESGERKLLNLGHTIGHAIERLSGFSISHGECVAKGLYAVLKVSQKYYGFDQTTFDKAFELISCKGHDLSCPYPAKELIEQIKVDKKSVASSVDAVLITEDLSAKTVKISFERLEELLK